MTKPVQSCTVAGGHRLLLHASDAVTTKALLQGHSRYTAARLGPGLHRQSRVRPFGGAGATATPPLRAALARQKA